MLPTGDDNKSAPEYVYSRIKEFCRDLQLIEVKDQFWLVLDKDRWRDDGVIRIWSEIHRNKRYDLRMAVSNPCFELWLYLHVSNLDDPMRDCRSVGAMLRKRINGYRKANPNMEILCPGVDDAVARAKRLDVDCTSPWPNNPGSHVYRLIEEIGSL